MSNVGRILAAAPGKLQRTGAAAGNKVNFYLRLLVIIATGWPTLLIAVAAIGTWKLHIGGGGLIFALVISIPVVALLFFGVDYLRTMGARCSLAVVAFTLGTAAILLVVLTVGLTPYREITLFDGRSAVMFLALVPFVALVGVLIWNPLKLIAGYSAGAAVIGTVNWATTRWLLKKAYVPSAATMVRWIISGFVIDALVGVYLSFVTISDDRWLIIPLVFVTLSLILLRIVNLWGGIRVLLTIAFWVITAIFCLGGQTEAAGTAARLGKKLSGMWPNSVPSVQVNFQRKVCEANFFQTISLEDLAGGADVGFNEGCFGGFIQLPATWPGWGAQPEGDHLSPDWWVSFWFKGEQNPTRIYTLADLKNNPPDFANRPGTFRLQGKDGQAILFYKIR